MNDFLDNIESDNSIFFDSDNGFAIIINYDGTDIKAVPDGGNMFNVGIPGVNSFERSFWIQETDVAEPKQGDPVIVDSVNFYVAGQPDYDGGLWLIRLSREIPDVIRAV